MTQTTVTISTPNGPIVGQSDMKQIGPLYIVNQAGGVMEILDTTCPHLINSGNSFTPPKGAVGAVIIVTQDLTSTPTVHLKGGTSDTGIAINVNQPFLITFANPGSPAPFWLQTTEASGTPVEISYF